MAFRVEIQQQALADLDSIADNIKARSSFASAEKWFNGLLDDIASLKEIPERCTVAPESEDLDREVRVLLHGRRNRSYKIYFPVHHETAISGIVSILHVRHWARRPVDADELNDLMDDQLEDRNAADSCG